jgi:hypothetical protein
VAKAPTFIKSLARAHTETAIAVLAGIMNQEKAAPAAKVAAASALLDRGWGKPTQPIAGDDDADAIRMQLIERRIIDPGNTNGTNISTAPST